MRLRSLRAGFDAPTILAIVGVAFVTAAGAYVYPGLGLAVFGAFCLLAAVLIS